MIDADKVKQFWEHRATYSDKVRFESISNLEHDKENLKLKIRLETKKIFEWLGKIEKKTILDLGAGVGQWAFRFAQRGAKKIDAVEYSEAQVKIGRTECLRKKINNIKFIISNAEDFTTNEKYDLIFISGLFVYLNDDQAAKLMNNLPKFSHKDTIILLRDGTSINKKHEINDKPSNHLGVNYSATYRTQAEYLQLFSNAGFFLVRHENMFSEHCVLNKYPETRLHLFEFNRNQ